MWRDIGELAEPAVFRGQSPPVSLALDLCRCYAPARRAVLFVGPVGAGKTSLARWTHELSGRRGAFVAVSAGEVSESLYGDALFGHMRGAFTGAHESRQGAFQRAANGTLLLDDLSFMPTVAQAAVLRAVEDRAFTPLGAVRDVPLTCREMYATTANPAMLVEQMRLLPDLESRIGELIVPVPALADRAGDIASLASLFRDRFVEEHELTGPGSFSEDCIDLLCAYDWPRNLRELKAVVERAVLHAAHRRSPVVHPHHLPERVRRARSAWPKPKRASVDPDLIQHAVRAAGGNRSEAARQLGVHRNTVARYLKDDRPGALTG